MNARHRKTLRKLISGGMIVVLLLLGWQAGASVADAAERDGVTIAKSAAVFTVQGRASESFARKTSAAGLPSFVLSSAGSWNLSGSKRWIDVESAASPSVLRLNADRRRERGPPGELTDCVRFDPD